MEVFSIFKDNTRYKAFFLSLLFSAIGFGLYKGVMDNYLAEIVKMNQDISDSPEEMRATIKVRKV